MTESKDNLMKVASLCKRRGFIYQGSEIYGGLAGTWDYGPLGVLLKENVKNLWWKTFVHDREDMYGIDAAILMNQNVWKASGHVDTFADPLIEDTKTKKRYRADHLLEDAGVDPKGLTLEKLGALIKEKGIKSPDGNPLGEVRQFNMMFKTHVGAMEDESAVSYLRPETAQGIFANFKNVVDSFHPKLPFGIAQIGKAFRNEIAPRDFIFRTREFEQMEIEYFIRPPKAAASRMDADNTPKNAENDEWESHFEHWREEMWKWIETIGLSRDSVHELEVGESDRAHYSKYTIDFEFDFPFGRKELYGLAYRTDYDLKKHSEASSVSLEYVDEESKTKFIPHVIEPTLGVDRTILALLVNAYTEDDMGGEKRVYLKFVPKIAPVKVAVFPLLKNKPRLVEKAREVYAMIKKEIPASTFDDNGNIGKRYRRQDEIGTPICVTVDFDSLENEDVTVRDRDTGKQERVSIKDLVNRIKTVL